MEGIKKKINLTPEQKILRTKWGIASTDFNAFDVAYRTIPKKYKRFRRMIKHQMDKLEKKMRETEKQFTYYGE